MAGSQCESENSEQLVRQCLHLPPEHAGAGSPGYGGGIGFSPRYGAHAGAEGLSRLTLQANDRHVQNTLTQNRENLTNI